MGSFFAENDKTLNEQHYPLSPTRKECTIKYYF